MRRSSVLRRRKGKEGFGEASAVCGVASARGGIVRCVGGIGCADAPGGSVFRSVRSVTAAREGRRRSDAPICPNGAVCYSPSCSAAGVRLPDGQERSDRRRPDDRGRHGLRRRRHPVRSRAVRRRERHCRTRRASRSSTSRRRCRSTAPATSNWAIETSLDVEYAHAMAPGANIVLAVAEHGRLDRTSRRSKSEVLPQYPGCDRLAELRRRRGRRLQRPRHAAALDKLFLEPGAQRRHDRRRVRRPRRLGLGPLVGASGADGGLSGASPFVLSVGGTMGCPYPDGLWNHGRYGGEQAWNERRAIFPEQARAAALRASSTRRRSGSSA